MKLRRNNAAPTSSTRHTATWAITRPLRKRWPVRPPLPRLPSSFNALMVAGLEVCNAGASPNTTPVAADTTTANNRVV